MKVKEFISQKMVEIEKTVGAGSAISALSGGVDSSVCTVLAWRALGNKLKVIFIDDGLMREGEPEQVRAAFGKQGINVEILNARKEFFAALAGKTDPEDKRKAFRQTFYTVFGHEVKRSGARFLVQGTIARRHHRDQGRRQDAAQHPRADRDRSRAGLRVQSRRTHQKALQARRPAGRQGAGPARVRPSKNALSRARAHGPDARRGHAREGGHRPGGDRDRRAGDPEAQPLPGLRRPC